MLAELIKTCLVFSSFLVEAIDEVAPNLELFLLELNLLGDITAKLEYAHISVKIGEVYLYLIILVV